MERWEDQAIVLAARAHGENGAILSVLSEHHGRHAGYVRGMRSSRLRGALECGNIVDLSWAARISDNLGSFALELRHNPSAHFLADSLRLAALQSACALCHEALPEREGHAGLFHGLAALLDTLASDVWGPSYVMWEIALLRELGFSLDLSSCAGGGDASDLAYVSPKTGRAVSRAAGEPYKDRLLKLPEFLRTLSLNPSPSRERENTQHQGGGDFEDILTGLKLTGHFLEHWAFAHHATGVPESRLRFQNRFENIFNH